MTCPHCGGDLTAVTLGGDHPPLLCAGCHLAFWRAELAAAEHWDAAYLDFGRGPHAAPLRAAVDAERLAN